MKKAAKGIIGLSAVLAVLGGGLAALKLTEPKEDNKHIKIQGLDNKNNLNNWHNSLYRCHHCSGCFYSEIVFIAFPFIALLPQASLARAAAMRLAASRRFSSLVA